MVLTLIVAALAGWAARPLEPRLTELLLGTLGAAVLSEAAARRVIALLVTLFCAAILLWVLGARSGLAPFVLAAGIGHFQRELREAVISRKS